MTANPGRRMALTGAFLLTVAVLAIGAILDGSTSARASTEFEGQANAAGLVVTAATQEDPTSTTVEAAGPVATAVVSSVPDSEAFAAYPYPGQDLLDLLNVAGASAPAAPPPYPLEVQSGSPGNGKESASQPGYSITATSSPTSSEGTGASGMTSGGTSFGSVQADATVRAPEGSPVVESTATTAADAVAVGPLTISSVISLADATLDQSGVVKTSSSMKVGDLAVNGVEVGFTDQGLTLAGTTTPLPSAGPLASALQQAGITISYLAASKTADGVVAPGIAISVHQVDPNGKPATLTYTLGQAAASAQPNPGTGLAAAPDLGSMINVNPPGLSGGQATGAAVAGASPAGAVPALAASTASVGGAATGPPQRSSSRPLPRTVAAASSQNGDLGGLFYILLVVSAVATLGMGQLIRIVGVRWARS